MDMMVGADFPTRCLGELVREKGVFSLEEIVHQLTERARRVSTVCATAGPSRRVPSPTSCCSTPTRSQPGQLHTIRDLPSGAPRLVTESAGIHRGARRGNGDRGRRRDHRRPPGPAHPLRPRHGDRRRALRGVTVAGIDLANDVCIGVDVGGTFTDAVLTDGVGIWRAKSPTTPGDVGTGVLAAVEIAARRAGSDPDVGAARSQAVRAGYDGGHERPRVPGRSAGRARSRREGSTSWSRSARGRSDPRRGRLADPPARDRVAAVRRRCRRADGPRRQRRASARSQRSRGARPGSSSRPSTSKRSRCRSSGPSGTLCTSSRRSPRSRGAPGPTAVSGAALHPAIREFERTTFALLERVHAGCVRRDRQLAAELAERGLPRSVVARALGRRLDLGGRGPAHADRARRVGTRGRGVGGRVGCRPARGRRPRHLRHGGHVASTCRSSNAVSPARRSRGELMGVWTALSLIDVESIGAGGGSTRVGRRPRHDAGRSTLGRRRARPRLLRARWQRRNRDGRARRARLTSTRRASSVATWSSTPTLRTRPARASENRWVSTRVKPRGASVSSRSPAW